jgi:amino acid transporter
VFPSPLVPELGADTMKIIAVAFTVVFTVVFTILSLFSVRETGRLQVIQVAILFVAEVLFAVLGIGRIEPADFGDIAPTGWGSVLAATGLVFVSFDGLTKMASVSKEAINPGKPISRGMFSAFGVVSRLQVVIVFILVGVLRPLGSLVRDTCAQRKQVGISVFQDGRQSDRQRACSGRKRIRA